MRIGDSREFTGCLDNFGILKLRWVVSNAMVRLADSLGLSPKSRHLLGITAGGGFDLAKAGVKSNNARTIIKQTLPLSANALCLIVIPPIGSLCFIEKAPTRFWSFDFSFYLIYHPLFSNFNPSVPM